MTDNKTAKSTFFFYDKAHPISTSTVEMIINTTTAVLLIVLTEVERDENYELCALIKAELDKRKIL
jgi:hypothetical protein